MQLHQRQYCKRKTTAYFTLVLVSVHLQFKKYTKNREGSFLKKIKKPILSNILFYIEDDDHKPVDFNGETISFTCQLNKIRFSYSSTYRCIRDFNRYVQL